MKSIGFVISIFVLLLSCQKNPTKSLDNASEDIRINNLTHYKDNLSKFFELRDSVILQLIDSIIFGQVDKIRFFNNNIYILDGYQARAVFVFDARGRFLKKISDPFQGDDFVYDFWIDQSSNTLQVLTLGKIINFSISDQWRFENILKIEFPAVRFAKKKGKYYFVCGSDSPMLVVTDDNLKYLVSYFPNHPAHSSWAYHTFIEQNEELLLFLNFSNKVYSLQDTFVKEKNHFIFDNMELEESELLKISDFSNEQGNVYFKNKILRDFFIPIHDDYLYSAYVYNGATYVLWYNYKTQACESFNATSIRNDLTNEAYFPLIIGKNSKDELVALKSLEDRGLNNYLLYYLAFK